MDYQQIIALARNATPLNRVRIQGGQTDGYIKPRSQPIHNLKTTKPIYGKNYALECQLEDEREEALVASTCKGNSMTVLEDVTSVGTVPDPNEINHEELTQVYDNYSFEKHNSSLLINNYKDLILEQVEVNPVTIIKGQTGCGKSTQVPQFILDNHANNNSYCNIIVTQPRRIAAITVAKRVCAERNWTIGSIVGYQIALDKVTSSDTRLLYSTTGVLLHQLIQKQSLSMYTHIFIDEVHERDQETDFLLILAKRLLKTPGCRTKIILMSATINTDKFVDYFSRKANGVKIQPPVIEVPSNIKYPVYFYYLDSLANRILAKIPQVNIENPQLDKCSFDLVCTLIEAFYTIDKREHTKETFIGSVLVFLPGLHEIEMMYEVLEKRKASGNPVKTKSVNEITNDEKWWLCPLHSTVTFDEQMKVFKPAPLGHRKIILATNIAESSITVPDVKYVIDFCLWKQQTQEADTSFSSLQLAWISKSQGSQRAGRVGRVMPGRVYRLVPEEIYNDLEEDTNPAMLRAPLDLLVLKAKSLGAGSPCSLLGRALDPPDLSNIHRTVLNLKEMGALLLTSNGKYVEDDGDLTFIGKVMTALPVDTHLSKLIITGHMFSLLTECVIMASAMAVKNVFSTPFKQQLDAYNAKLSWADSSCSDPIAFLNAYKVWRFHKDTAKFERSKGKSEMGWAKRNFIQLQSMREVFRLEKEILVRLKHLGIVENNSHSKVTWKEDTEKPLILKLIIAGAFYPNYFIIRQMEEKEAVKILGGRDPYSTVYLTNMPINQPGKLYANSIKKHFEHCGSMINVTFDGSSKVYLQFGSSALSNGKMSQTSNTVTMPGKIMMAVYRAIKLRHLQIPIVLHMLTPQEATKRAEVLYGNQSGNGTMFCLPQKPELNTKTSLLPGLHTNHLQVYVSHIESPSQFWVQLTDQCSNEKLDWVLTELNKPGALIPFQSLPGVGSLCVAPYFDGQTLYFRARVKAYGSDNVQVYFVDYGNKEWVKSNDLRDFSGELVQQGIKDEPEMALECLLSEVQPSVLWNSKGVWATDVNSLFKKHFLNKNAFATVFSVVNGIMSLYLYKDEILKEALNEIPVDRSFNMHLIKRGFADHAEEPYLSRENHLSRQLAMEGPHSSHYDTNGVVGTNAVEMEPPPDKDCKLKVYLKGPRSPLELSLLSVTRKSLGIDVHIEWNSVNSVLLDTYPMDHHMRMLVAGFITQSPSGDRLTLRNTTMMPNIHGLCSLIALIFSPCSELRVDKGRSKFTGVLCGLGADPDTKIPYNSDGDLELAFDTVFDLDDLENINRLRFWMNYLVFGGMNWEEESSRPRVVSAQSKVKDFILKILSKERCSMAQELNPQTYEWGLVPEKYLLHPRDDPSQAEERASIYPLIWGVDIVPDRENHSGYLKNLEILSDLSTGKVAWRNGVLCMACQMYLDTLQNLRLHLQTSIHREACKPFTQNP